MTAKIILDSIAPNGYRLTTMEVTFHRFVLAEFNTHRVFSRNSASSRAIPVTKQLERLATSTATPVRWPKEQPGMQGGDHLEGDGLEDAMALWNTVESFVIGAVEAYVADHPDAEYRLHKSLLNRLMEPFMWHTVIVSSTEWDNFFEQRCSPLAQPEIRVAAESMMEVYVASDPEEVDYGQWHTPYIQPDEADMDPLTKLGVSAARCARVSYLTHDGTRDWTQDRDLFTRLVTAQPPHWSPLEHVASPEDRPVPGNFDGWLQLRHTPSIITSWAP